MGGWGRLGLELLDEFRSEVWYVCCQAGMEADGKMRHTQRRGAARAILAGCGAALIGWAGILYFFTNKDNPYELGWFFMLLGLAGMVTAAGLSALVMAGIVREKGAFVLTRPVKVMLACPFMPLLGWTGALAMAYTDATPGSGFMVWAFAFGMGGFLAPLVTAGLVRFQARSAAKTARSGKEIDKKPIRVHAAVYAAAAAPGLTAAVLFTLSGDFQYDRFFSMVLVLGSVTFAAALPALIAVMVSFGRKARRLVVGLALWLVCTALLMGLLLGFYILYEIVDGILHFRL